jgi:hypothetical protein
LTETIIIGVVAAVVALKAVVKLQAMAGSAAAAAAAVIRLPRQELAAALQKILEVTE